VLFVAPDFTDEKSSIENYTEDQHDKEDDAENQQRHFTPVENYPTDIQRDGECDEARAQRDEERY
jgi:hypothetical protein